ncbi:hypothetical protein XENOCAPTIV_014469, partial [Xenoophorus captivus]
TNLELELVHRGGNLCSGGASAAAKRSCLSDHVGQSSPSGGSPCTWVYWYQAVKKSINICIPFSIIDDQLFHVLAMHMRIYSIDSAYNPWTKLTQIVQRKEADGFDEERPEVPMLFRDVPSLLIIFVLTMPQPLRKAQALSICFCPPVERFICVIKMLFNLQFTQALAALSTKLSSEERQAWVTSGILKKSARNSEKSFEALLSHVISELSKDKSVYKVNREETTMSLLGQDPQWAAPRLLRLPDNYNIIFQYYHRKACTACKKVPKDPALCLVCGAFVCLKGVCCKHQGTCECVLVSLPHL